MQVQFDDASIMCSLCIEFVLIRGQLCFHRVSIACQCLFDYVLISFQLSFSRVSFIVIGHISFMVGLRVKYWSTMCQSMFMNVQICFTHVTLYVH